MIYLTKTDTTIGFLSQSLEELNRAKNRPINQPCIICVASFDRLKSFVRVPQKYKNRIRRSRKTTFIYPNSVATYDQNMSQIANSVAIRVVKDHPHSELLEKLGWAYSSSANRHNEPFNMEFAMNAADEVIGDICAGCAPSVMLKISSTAIKKIR